MKNPTELPEALMRNSKRELTAIYYDVIPITNGCWILFVGKTIRLVVEIYRTTQMIVLSRPSGNYCKRKPR